MCGIVGIVGHSAVNQQIYDALTVLQHRGQDAAGIMTSYDGELFMRKQTGLVRDVFQHRHVLGDVSLDRQHSDRRSSAVLRSSAGRSAPAYGRVPGALVVDLDHGRFGRFRRTAQVERVCMSSSSARRSSPAMAASVPSSSETRARISGSSWWVVARTIARA